MKNIKEYEDNNDSRDVRKFRMSMILILLLIILVLFISGCSFDKSMSYSETVQYCYNQNMSILESCHVEKCVMLNSAQFSSDIRFTAEKNYYQCKLIECK